MGMGKRRGGASGTNGTGTGAGELRPSQLAAKAPRLDVVVKLMTVMVASRIDRRSGSIACLVHHIETNQWRQGKATCRAGRGVGDPAPSRDAIIARNRPGRGGC